MSPLLPPPSLGSLVPVSGCVFAHYAPASVPGGVAVVSPSGVVLAGSFFELRARFSLVCVLAGAGGWVALRPVRSLSFRPPAVQPSLF